MSILECEKRNIPQQQEDWIIHAECANQKVNPNILFHEDQNKNRPLRQAVKDMCLSCPVAVECLVDAYESGQWDGVWGGLTPNERKKHRYLLSTPDFSLASLRRVIRQTRNK